MTYYSLWDGQNGGYMHTGRNSTNRDDLKAELLGYISGDTEPEDLKKWERESLESICEFWEFDIHEHDQPIAEDV